MGEFLNKYFTEFNKSVVDFLNDDTNRENLKRAVGALKKAKNGKTTIYLIGNGGSSAVAEHMAIDLTKNAGLAAIAFSGSPLLTTFSNDYGYENVFKKAIDHLARKNDILIAISSSGRSRNILNACKAAKKKKMTIITFSGFDKNNPLRSQGDLNFWVNSKAFGYVELIHNLLIHYINDAIIGSSEYMIR